MGRQPYVPDEEELVTGYAEMMTGAGEPADVADADARRGIARIKADAAAQALRDAADEYAPGQISGMFPDRTAYTRQWLRDRAARFESEADG